MDVFISYRRDGAESLAQLLYSRLKDDGYSVFLDVESLRSGRFNEAIYDQIDTCNDFLLLLPPKGLDRCYDQNDWVRLEVERAIEKKKNIIPVFMRNFEFPAFLPGALSNLPLFNGIKAEMDYFDAVLCKLESMLNSNQNKDKHTKYTVVKDPNLSEEEISCIYFYLMNDLTLDDIAADSEMVDAVFKYYGISGLNEINSFVVGRKILYRISYSGVKYHIFDVFIYNNCKYAYALRADVKPFDQQIGVFFKIDANERLALFFDLEQERINTEQMAVFRQFIVDYSTEKRGLGAVPEALYETYEQTSLAALTNESLCSNLMVNQYMKEGLSLINDMGTEEFLAKQKKANTNLLTKSIIEGKVNGIEVWITNGNCFQSWHAGRYAGRLVKTPIKNKIILDIIPVQPIIEKERYLALVYPIKKKKRRIYIIDKPEYYQISKSNNDNLYFEKIAPNLINAFCGDYFERFALIYLQARISVPWSFLDY